MTSRLDVVSLEHTASGLEIRAASLVARAEHLAAVSGDARRWGFLFEAEQATRRGRCCRVEAMMLGARAAGFRALLGEVHP